MFCLVIFPKKALELLYIYYPDADSTKPVNQGFKGLGNQK